MTKLTTPTGKEILIVDLPEGAYLPKYETEKLIGLVYYIGKKLHPVSLPPGDWHLSGKLSEVTEEQAKQLVQEPILSFYRNYTSYMSVRTAVESFHSWLKSIGITEFENKYLLIKK